MSTINVQKFGLACGLTGLLLYLNCIILMITVGRNGTITFFNGILHGLDVTPIVRMNIPWWEAILGIVEIFILTWLIGACVAGIYNVTIIKNK